MVVDRSVDSERNTFPPPETQQNCRDADTEDDPFCLLRQAFRGKHEVVDHVRKHEHGEVQCWQLKQPSAFNLSYTTRKYIRSDEYM